MAQGLKHAVTDNGTAMGYQDDFSFDLLECSTGAAKPVGFVERCSVAVGGEAEFPLHGDRRDSSSGEDFELPMIMSDFLERLVQLRIAADIDRMRMFCKFTSLCTGSFCM